jgi:predicted XRE-type DNA-binding protein
MNAATRRRLEAAGWRVGTAAEFLGLTREEEALIGMRLALSDALKRERRKKRLSQKQLAERLQSSQSRVAKMEAGDTSVTLDLLIQALLVAGATRAQVGRAIAGGGRRAAQAGGRAACRARRRRTWRPGSGCHFVLDSPTRPAILRDGRSPLGGLCLARLLS